MNVYFISAAALAFVVGVVHSALGEILIFRRMRAGGLVPVNGGSALTERHVRILWASWHALTVFGWFIAAALGWLGKVQDISPESQSLIAIAIVVAMTAGSLLVLIGTKGRHPGWVGLLGVAILAWLGMGAGGLG